MHILSLQFWNTVLECGARLPIHTLIKLLYSAVSGARFLTGGCVWVWHCSSAICGSIMYAILYQVYPDTPSLWCSSCTVCAGAGYTRCFGSHISILIPFLAATPRSVAGLLFSLMKCLCGKIYAAHVFDGVGLACFKSRDVAFLLA